MPEVGETATQPLKTTTGKHNRDLIKNIGKLYHKIALSHLDNTTMQVQQPNKCPYLPKL